MSKKFLTFFSLFGVSLIAATVFSQVTLASFDPNNLIDDGIFNNTTTMTVGQINSFLNGFSGSCISPNNGFSAPDPTGYSPTGGFVYGGSVSAGQVIYDAAQAYGINPQVLLTTLQKEQSLVTGGGGCDVLAYTGATGYGCPDGGTTYNYSGVDLYSINGNMVTSVNGTCVNSSLKAGFSQQVIRAAWLLEFGMQRAEDNSNWAVIKGSWNNSDDPQSCYGGPVTQGYRQVCPSGATTYYDGYITIDGSSVHVENGATAALYWYTPHFSGNQHFDTIFSGWFGNLYVPQYSWQTINQTIYTDSSKATPIGWNATLISGQTAYAVLTVKNTGNITWTKGGSPAINLATWGPQDRNSAFCVSGTWLSCNRVVQQDEVSVAPGANATFEFPIKAPTTPGVYNEGFNLVAEGAAWFPSAGQFFQITVQPPTWSWSEVNQTAFTDASKTTAVGWNTGNMLPGQKVYVVVTARNTGNQTWTNNGANPVDIGTWNAQDRTSGFQSSWVSSNRPAAMAEASVAPGATGSFGFWMQAPNNTGDYKEYFNLVAEGKTWMNPTGMFVASTVMPKTYTWQPLGQTVYTDSSKATALGWNATVTHGQTAWVVMSVKNTGNVTWLKNTPGSPAINVGTWNPQDRNSAFCVSGTWLSCNRAATMDESSVAPGASATFEFPVQVPAQTGTYNEYFNLVAEGATWMNPTGMFVKFTVQ